MAVPMEESDRALERLKVPPHSVEAERAVLGGLMLDNSTWEQIGDRLRSEDFYRRDHQLIFSALMDHAERLAPFDVVTVGDWLKARDELEAGGGLAYLIGLSRDTPSAVNVRAYADIVRERAMLRDLISAGGEIAGSAFATEGRPLAEIIDDAERRVFEIAERGHRSKQGFRQIRTLLKDAVDRLHELQASKSHITGLPTGISDFDQLTAGLQPGDLIIIAGRPSMGKCLAHDSEIVLGDGSVCTIETLHARKCAELLTLRPDWRLGAARPSDYVDDGVKPVYRVTTRLGRRIETTLSHPFLTVEGWRPLAQLEKGTRVAVPRALPVFGNEEAPEHEAVLLGYLLGDGTLGSGSPGFTNTNPVMQSDFTRAVGDFGGLRVTAQDSSGTRALTLFVAADRSGWEDDRRNFGARLRAEFSARGMNGRAVAQGIGAAPSTVSQWLTGTSAPSGEMGTRLVAWLTLDENSLLVRAMRALAIENRLVAWLAALGIRGCGAAQKFVPEPVFKWRRERVATFLNRLFATDGWATVLATGQAQLGYCSVSERLARQ
ncbi:MAG: DnaB-like helicase N-terminal domain-containing protein, partial [Gammaproteobacteria bacterium]